MCRGEGRGSGKSTMTPCKITMAFCLRILSGHGLKNSMQVMPTPFAGIKTSHRLVTTLSSLVLYHLCELFKYGTYRMLLARGDSESVSIPDETVVASTRIIWTKGVCFPQHGRETNIRRLKSRRRTSHCKKHLKVCVVLPPPPLSFPLFLR